jgi:hypothetical protein
MNAQARFSEKAHTNTGTLISKISAISLEPQHR